jgi:hypothetical protein
MYVHDVDSGLLGLLSQWVCKISFQVWISVYISRFIHMYYVDDQTGNSYLHIPVLESICHMYCKGKLALSLNNSAPCHKDIWTSVGIAPPFLCFATGGGEWSVSHPRPLYPGEKSAAPTGQEAGWVPKPVQIL